MSVKIVYPSALEYWLEEKGVPRGVNIFPVGEALLSGKKGVRQQADFLSFKKPVHVAVPKKMNRVGNDEIICHAMPKALEPESFWQVADGVFLSSPELCFLQAARELPIHKLVQLANNLCAIYVLDPYEDFGQRRRDPITSAEEIQKFLNGIGRFKNIQTARTAARYILDRANSPMESNLATIGILPWRYGGYSLKKPCLNEDIGLSKTGAEHLGRETICCDMVWKDEKVVLEYDSNLAHLSPDQHTEDKKRITALSLSGYQVISVTAKEVRSFRDVEELFLRIRTALGMRTDSARVDKHFKTRDEVVHEIMFPTNRTKAMR